MQNFTHPLFDEVYHFSHLSSTMSKAESMIRGQLAQGNALFIADRQSGGMGRRHAGWYSPDGGLWVTAALYGMAVQSYFTLFIGVCIHKALCRQFPSFASHFSLKWPNDIFLDGKKVGGILTTHQPNRRYHFVGMGIDTNVPTFPHHLSTIATSTLLATETTVDNRVLLTAICDEIAEGLPQIIEGVFPHNYFAENCLLTGKTVILDTDFEQFSGLCKGINSRGALMLELAPGMIQPFYAGSVVSWEAAKNTEELK